MKLGLSVVFLASLLAACGGGAVTQAQHVAPTCGPPPPSAAPNVVLIYPDPAATDVTTTIGIAVVSGSITTRYGTGTLADYNGVPPLCTGLRTQPLGSFMTK